MVAEKKTINEALVAALSELEDVPKRRTARVPMKGGGSYTYEYADLADVLAEVKPILSKHGLAVLQEAVTTSLDGLIGVTTHILHSSGEEKVFGPLLLHPGATPQTAGSAITYCRRYALMAALGIASEDDDGQAAAAPPKQAAPELTDEQQDLVDAMNKIEPSNVRAAIKALFVSEFGKPHEVKPSQIEAAAAWIDAQLANVEDETADGE